MSSDVAGAARDNAHALIGGFHHVGVQTTELDNSISWYQEFFGCEVSWTLERFSDLSHSRLPGIVRLAELKAGSLRFHLFTVDPENRGTVPAQADQFQHLCLQAPSPDALEQWRDKWMRLYSSGRYTFARDEPASRIDTDPDGMQSFYAFDVNGLEYEFSFFPGE